jgi:hypothetical protein
MQDMGCQRTILKVFGTSYNAGILMFQMSHSQGFSNISSMRIETDTGTIHEVGFEPALVQNQMKNIIINNISINKEFNIFIGSCKNGNLEKV